MRNVVSLGMLDLREQRSVDLAELPSSESVQLGIKTLQ
jgi:hypothetical protein